MIAPFQPRAARPDSLSPATARGLPGGWIPTALIAWLGIDQLLLWRFLDVVPAWGYALGATLLVILCHFTLRSGRNHAGPTPATLLCCITVALALLTLGGEGRFLYANADWQVRFAVLRDLHINPWPYVYQVGASAELLRAPIGMFLLPAALAKAVGPSVADIALLVQNALLLGMLLALGSTLFDSRRARLVALAVFIGFSGLDIIGRNLFREGLSDHLENWAYLQYSSTLTLIFWVPQHALSGWIGAVGFLLWRSDRLPLSTWLTLMPLTALWSPLGLIGALPFAALAGWRSLTGRRLVRADIALPAAATLLSLPSLAYLAAGAGEGVGLHVEGLLPLQWALFELLEVLVYVVPLVLLVRQGRFGGDTLLIVTLCLLCIPFIRIGWSTDFMMRASITALAILAILVADALLTVPRARLWLVPPLLIGTVTGWYEVRRAFAHPPAPQLRCSLVRAWDFEALELGIRKPGDPPSPKGTYLAPLANVPAIVRPHAPKPARMDDPPRCWDGHWYYPAAQTD